MKYLFMDTQIFLDLAVNRQKAVSDKQVALLSKLLNNNEVKLIVPQIVKYETLKHLEEEVMKIKVNLETAISKIDNLYWINGISDSSFDLKEYKRNAKKYLQDLLDIFMQGKESYIAEVDKAVSELFQNNNTINIPDDEMLLQAAWRRKIYKRAPSHKENKESNGDALIAETLINIKSYITLSGDDKIYFISRNIEDFSQSDGKEARNNLHSHLIEDLSNAGILEQIEYRIDFNKCIGVDFEAELENANLAEEFEREFLEQQAAQEADYYREAEGNLRESFGLPSLSSFDNWLNSELENDEGAQRIVEIFELYGNLYEEFEELFCSYDDELLPQLNGYLDEECPSEVKLELIEEFNKFLIDNKERFYCYCVEDINDWVEIQESKVKFETENFKVPDNIDFDQTFNFVDKNRTYLYLSWEDTELYPESGESHTIYGQIRKKIDGSLVCEGRIEINYGFAEEDDDGNAGDGCEAGIDVYLQNIIDKLEEVYSELDALKNKQQEYVETIANLLNHTSTDL